MTSTPWYCRYGVHGDISRQTNIDGTALYRTRARPCDCPPPLAQPLVHAPRRPSEAARRPQNGRGRVRGASVSRRRFSEEEKKPLANSVTAGVLRAPLMFYTDGLRVVVPPIAVDYSSDTSTLQAHPSPFEECGRDVMLPVLPSIPVVWPQPDPPPRLPDVVTSLPCPSATTVEDAAPPPLPPPNTDTVPAVPLGVTTHASMEDRSAAEGGASCPLPSLPTPSLPTATNVARAAEVCSAEGHALHRRWGIAYCSRCGLRLNPDAAAGAAATTVAGGCTTSCSPETCPLGPHVPAAQSPSPSNASPADGARDHRYCLLCGADLNSSGARAPTAASPQGDLLTRRDMQSVEEIMAHMLGRAHTNHGSVQPPCGLPSCRLCERADTSLKGAMAGHGGSLRTAAETSLTDKWWSAPVMCGSPAVSIIHNHYYR